ncbi:hypothetical protein L2X99_01185 [Microbacterium sp. KUDC0406]|uniref:hypothetical protein n=1 Tax=Microbacterium sp. KUDC0406 TaxID=2909588 RepID=UPI001F1C7FF4|nr:hypothetical protein [Microbacterium sp. KUDC0406]UJP10357.1 hypothetical protein L2X99_01185 [Microbacterium sp. KUDC0406]
MTTAQKDVVWQRLPQGWIEFRSFGDATPAQWWQNYLSTGEGWLTDDVRATLTTGFEQGVALFADAPFDFAGMHLEIGARPAVWFLSTQVARGTPDASEEAEGSLAYLAAARLGAAGSSTSFTASDGRTGLIAFGLAGNPAHGIVAVGQLALPDSRGVALVTGMTTDPERYEDLLIRVAFALDTTLVLPAGELPPDLDPAE